MPCSIDARTVDLNADVGEGSGNDPLLFPIISSANIACGVHAGNIETIRETLKLAQEYGVSIGAHPGFADREHFGRRILPLSPTDIRELVQSQVERLSEEAQSYGLHVRYLKPHGGLFHLAHQDPPTAQVLIELTQKYHLALVGLPNSLLQSQCENRVRFIAEGYADRAYTKEGQLVPRDQPHAIIHSLTESLEQVRKLIAQGVQTICIHGDHPEAVTFANQLRRELQNQGITIRAFL